MNLEKSSSKKLPNEIFLFKKINNDNLDPIKKEIYNFSEILYIMNNISPFPVNIEKYYYYKYDINNPIQFSLLLTLNYISYKLSYDNFTNLNLDKNDLIHSINFVHKFFDCTKPFNDPDNSMVWIYPKYTIRKFLVNSILNKEYNAFFIDEETIIKLIMIIADFSLYELSNLDDKILSKGIYLNYPTLILGNIKLYEKGIIKILETQDGLSIILDFNSTNSIKNKNITSDKEKLKQLIIQVLNDYKKLKYSMEDFFE